MASRLLLLPALEELTKVKVADFLASATDRLYNGCVTGKEMVRKLQKAGWVIDRIRGSHHVMKKGNITIPVPSHAGKQLKRGTEHDIIKRAGLK